MTVGDRLDEAREARRQGDGARCIEALRRALDQAGREAPDMVDPIVWRLAKAEHDFGTAGGVLDALEPLLSRDDPFAQHVPPTRAVDRVARYVQDRIGYGDPRPARLWEAFSAHHRDAGDPALAAHGDVQRAWWLACRGRLDDLRALLDRYGRLGPADFELAPHRHARAAEPGHTAWWIQMDLARTTLQAATWAGVEPLAYEASEAYEDAVEDTGLDRAREFWFLDAQLRAALRFGWSDVRARYEDAWRQALARDDVGVQGLIGRGLTAGLDGAPDAVDLLDRAATTALSEHLGPEWAADAWIEAARIVREPWRERAAEVVSRYALDVFRPALEALDRG